MKYQHLFYICRKSSNIPVWVIGALLLTAIGCLEPGGIGLEVQPEGEEFKVEFSDTTSIVAFSVREDSLLSSLAIRSPLGSYSDPVFGYVGASIYTQFSLLSNDVNFGSGFTPNSLVMTIGYAGKYGDAALQAQTINVYQVGESFFSTSIYYSNKKFKLGYPQMEDDEGDFDLDPAKVIASVTVTPQDNDSVVVINFDDILFSSDDSILADNSAFQSFIRGFYITTDTTDLGGIFYLDFLSPYTKLTLNYNDSLSFDFIINSTSATVNHFAHSYAGTVVESQLNDSTLGDSLVYIQALAGVKSKVKFPFLSEWVKNQKIAINKAELVINVLNEDLTTYPAPEAMFLLGAGANVTLTDQLEGASYFGGTYDLVARQYKFNIARHIHEVLYEGLPNDGLLLIIPNNLLTTGSVVSANRAIIGGGTNNSIGMKLNLTYTVL